jgi:hypothetical protein
LSRLDKTASVTLHLNTRISTAKDLLTSVRWSQRQPNNNHQNLIPSRYAPAVFAMSLSKYQDIVFDIVGQIGIIKFNRPKSLNSFGGKLMVETITAIRELNEHPDTVFTVLTGEGRFFSAGADVKGMPT